MKMSIDRNWLDPNTYKPQNVKTNSSLGYNQALFLLKNIYPVIYSVLTHIWDLTDWQIQQLNPLYKKLLKLLQGLLSTNALSFLSAYSPDLPSNIVDKSLVEEIQNSHWEDIWLFKKIIDEEKLDIRSKELCLPKDIYKTLQKISQLVLGKSLDVEILAKTTKADKVGTQKIILYSNGDIIFSTSEGEEYKTNIDPDSNGYLLLYFLSNKYGKVYSYKELTKEIFKTDITTQEKEIREAMKYIKKKLILPPDTKLFIVRKGVGLNCSVEIRN